MHIILGANGHVGSAVANALLEAGEAVKVVSRDDRKAGKWKRKGAQLAVADVLDTDALRAVFRQGQRLFLLNPPADPSMDTDTEERKTLRSILAALGGSGLEKVVAESTYGAQPGERLADSGVLYEMEQALAAQPVPATIVRAAYYMSNWKQALITARKEGEVRSFYPLDFKLPMVAPRDIGQVAARLLMETVESTGLHHVEGPERYSPSDVAAAFAAALQSPVRAVEIPRSRWMHALRGMGFSERSAESFAAMTAVTQKAPDFPDAPTRGTTTLRDYVQELVRASDE